MSQLALAARLHQLAIPISLGGRWQTRAAFSDATTYLDSSRPCCPSPTRTRSDDLVNGPIGKTSVLLRLHHLLPFPPFRPVYFDLMDRARKPLGTVLYELAATIAEFDIPQPHEADFGPTGESFRSQFLPSFSKG